MHLVLPVVRLSLGAERRDLEAAMAFGNSDGIWHFYGGVPLPFKLA